MKSGISFYNKKLIQNNLKMYGITGLFWAIYLFIGGPLSILNNKHELESVDDLLYRTANYFTVFVVVLAASALGMLYFYFLKTDNGVAFFMSLPVKKSEIFVSQYLTAFLLYILPIVLNGAFLYFILLTRLDSAMALEASLMWTTLLIAIFLNAFTISTMLSMVTGSIVLNILFNIIFYYLPFFFGASLEYLARGLLKGYAFNGKIRQTFETIDIGTWIFGGIYRNSRFYLLQFGIYFLVVLAIAYGLYFYKKHEKNKEWICFDFLKYIFVVGFTYCSVIINAAIFTSIFSEDLFYVYFGSGVGAIVGYIISVMIAWKTVYLKKAWWGVVASCGIVVISMIGIANLSVFESYIPSLNQISEVEVFVNDQLRIFEMEDITLNRRFSSNSKILFREKENIHLVREVHKTAIENENGDEIIRITYTLKNGQTVERYYNTFDMEKSEALQKLRKSDENLEFQYEILQSQVAQEIREIRIINAANATEEVYTGEKMRELLKLVQEEIVDAKKRRKSADYRTEKDYKIRIDEELPFVIRLKKAMELSKQGIARKDGESSELYMRGELPKLRQWLAKESKYYISKMQLLEEIERVEVGQMPVSELFYEDGYIRDRDSERLLKYSEEVQVLTRKEDWQKVLANSGSIIAYHQDIMIPTMRIVLKNGNEIFMAMTQADKQRLFPNLK